ncbi:TetR/AcrR family transcriptional regulator [Nocardioides sp. R-C-SC26]|uniref:TetR/AcrR family transcriptional regulator n=1 Tax=Nocardioides sp. R-C-SC26 TaxID=2870414 RepID=UPI001E55EFDB|nr:TetR/AcrR family transcriptional regulator [Nocardioides sp. R-C-SC26]
MSAAERLLDATIDCLAEHGYAATTTRKVAEIAGLSQGALQHYFPTKGALVEAALTRLTQQLLAEAAQRIVDVPDERTRAESLLDLILDIHQLPIAAAVIELLVAARTDPALGRSTASMMNGGMATITSFAAQALPGFGADPRFADFVQLAMATARGTAVMTGIEGATDAHPSWPVVRAYLLECLE